jgi:Zinc-binding dehydrogenase
VASATSLQFLRATSKVRVLAVDVNRARLDLGAELGADDGVLTGPDAAAGIVAANGGRKVDAVLDFVGAQQSRDLAAAVTGRGGAIVVTGGGGGRLSITAQMGAGGAPDREIAIVHTFGGTRDDLVRALALAEAGRVRTHVEVFELTAAGRVLADLKAGKVQPPEQGRPASRGLGSAVALAFLGHGILAAKGQESFVELITGTSNASPKRRLNAREKWNGSANPTLNATSCALRCVKRSGRAASSITRSVTSSFVPRPVT